MLVEKQPPSWPHGPGAAAHALQNSSSVVLKNPAFFFLPPFQEQTFSTLCLGVYMELKTPSHIHGNLFVFFAIYQHMRRLIRLDI